MRINISLDIEVTPKELLDLESKLKTNNFDTDDIISHIVDTIKTNSDN